MKREFQLISSEFSTISDWAAVEESSFFELGSSSKFSSEIILGGSSLEFKGFLSSQSEG